MCVFMCMCTGVPLRVRLQEELDTRGTWGVPELPELCVCSCMCACVCVCGAGSEGPWKSKNPEQAAGQTGYPRLAIVVSLTGVHACMCA